MSQGAMSQLTRIELEWEMAKSLAPGMAGAFVGMQQSPISGEKQVGFMGDAFKFLLMTASEAAVDAFLAKHPDFRACSPAKAVHNGTSR